MFRSKARNRTNQFSFMTFYSSSFSSSTSLEDSPDLQSCASNLNFKCVSPRPNDDNNAPFSPYIWLVFELILAIFAIR